MKFKLIRTQENDTSKLGELYINDKFFSNTVEFVYNVGPGQEYKCGLVSGEYSLHYDYSNRMRQYCFWLQSKPNVEGICQHSLKFRYKDSNFILFGISITSDSVASEKYYLKKLNTIMEKLKERQQNISFSIQ